MAEGLTYFLAFIFTCVLSGLAHGGTAQIPFSPGQDEKPDNSNLILASLHSLLKSWSQAYAPHGHAILPVTVKTGTLLYHMGGKRPPKYMQWFA